MPFFASPVYAVFENKKSIGGCKGNTLPHDKAGALYSGLDIPCRSGSNSVALADRNVTIPRGNIEGKRERLGLNGVRRTIQPSPYRTAEL